MYPTLFSFPPPSQAYLIHFFQNRPSSNIMMELPCSHEASKRLQATHTFKTTLPSRIKYTMYLYLLQGKAKRKWGKDKITPKPLKTPYAQQVFKEESALTQDISTHLLPLSRPIFVSLLSYKHCTNSLPGPTACLKMLICSLELQISFLG